MRGYLERHGLIWRLDFEQRSGSFGYVPIVDDSSVDDAAASVGLQVQKHADAADQPAAAREKHRGEGLRSRLHSIAARLGAARIATLR